MLRPRDGVNNRAGLLHVAVFANGSIEVSGFEELFPGDAGDALDHLRGIPREMFPQQLEHAIRVLQSYIELDFFRKLGSGWSASAYWMRLVSAACPYIVPCGFVVALRFGVKTGEYAVGVGGHLEIAFDDERRVRVVGQVIFCDAVVLDGITNDAAEESDVRASANLAEEVGDRGGAREARVDRDYLCIASAFRFDRPLEPAGMVLGRITAHD